MIITIDGPAAAGKGTLAAALAKRYRLAYFDTGMVYRAVGLEMVLEGLDVQNEEQAAQTASKLTFVKMMELSGHRDFRSDVGSRAASIVSAHPKVRETGGKSCFPVRKKRNQFLKQGLKCSRILP